MLRSLIIRVVALCACAAFACSVAWAIITGSISGDVTDPSGAAVAGVTVVATNQGTGVQSTTVSPKLTRTEPAAIFVKSRTNDRGRASLGWRPSARSGDMGLLVSNGADQPYRI